MNKMDQVDALMKQGISDGVFPGGVLLVARSEKLLFFHAYGQANIFKGKAAMPDTVFDLASLTKPLATTLAVMMMIQEGRLGLGQQVAEIIPEFEDTDKAGIQIEHLLTHVSGLPDYRPYYKDLIRHSFSERKSRLTALIRNEPLIQPTAEKTIYSDIGFMLLALLIEKITGSRLDDVVRRKVYQPLGIDDLFFIDTRAPKLSLDFAATEDCSWRQTVLEGVVHDENAYALGGAAGHAGLFGTAESVYKLLLRLLKMFHGADDLFAPTLVRKFLSPQPGRERALGFDMPSPNDSSAGDFFKKKTTVGHLGFTGTSFWMALDADLIVILLTNRIHPSRANEAIKTFRPRLHNSIMTSI